jgi:hypothetical protein
MPPAVITTLCRETAHTISVAPNAVEITAAIPAALSLLTSGFAVDSGPATVSLLSP